jgi:hypothetical protein
LPKSQAGVNSLKFKTCRHGAELRVSNERKQGGGQVRVGTVAAIWTIIIRI